MIDHETIDDNKLYQCMDCHGIAYGFLLDWFENEPETICPICGHRCDFIDIDDDIKFAFEQRVPTSDEVDEYLEMDAMNE